MSSNEKDAQETLNAQEKLREELGKQQRMNPKGRPPEEMAALQKKYEDAKTEKLKREMALAKYESDFLMAKVPKEKTDALKKLIENIENKEDKQELEDQKEENIEKKIALEKEIAQIKEENKPLLDKELENKESEYAKEYIKLIAAIDEQNKKVTEARLKFEGIDERPLKSKNPPRSPVEAYETGSPRYNDKRNVESSNNVKSNAKDFDILRQKEFIKNRCESNGYTYQFNGAKKEIELVTPPPNRNTIVFTKDKASTSSDDENVHRIMIQEYLLALVKDGKDLSQTRLEAQGKDEQTRLKLQDMAEKMKDKLIQQLKNGEFNVTNESEPKGKLELSHKETIEKPVSTTGKSSSSQPNDSVVPPQTRPRGLSF